MRPRRPTDSNAAYLCNNWYHFWEMSGDQVTEQAIHEVDLANWFIGRFPVSAFGMGARWRRPAGIGDIYDEIAIDYDYGDELHTTTFGRHMTGCANPFGTRLVGTEGEISVGNKIKRWDGKPVEEDLAAIAGRPDNGLIAEHKDFLAGLLSGNYLNEDYNAMIEAARAETDPAKRLDLLVSIEKKLIEEDCVVAGIYDRGYSYLQRPYVENYIVHPVGQSAEFKWTSINK